MEEKCGIIYWHRHKELECDDEYIGEPAITSSERFKEHLKAPLPINGHQTTTGHLTTMGNFSIVGRKEQGFVKTMKESIFIMVHTPILNMNIGKYTLPHI